MPIQIGVKARLASVPRPLDVRGLARVSQQIAIEGVVVAEKGMRAAIASLGEVMRQAENDPAGEASHGRSVRPKR